MNNKKKKNIMTEIFFDTWYIGVIKEKEGKIMQSSAELKRQAKESLKGRWGQASQVHNPV